MPSELRLISVIIPLGPDDAVPTELLHELAISNQFHELIIVVTHSRSPLVLPNASVVFANQGRAIQQNSGANAATGDHLWFLHADSKLTPGTIIALTAGAERYPEAILFSRLSFLPDGPRLMRLNELGAHFRSHWLRLPFGDQGLCIPRGAFKKLGGFPEDLSFGEDHALIWRAHFNSIPLRATDATIWTSARRYRQVGWLKTSTTHIWLTLWQSLSEIARGILILLRQKMDQIFNVSGPSTNR